MGKKNSITFEIKIESCEDIHFKCPYFKSFRGMKLERRCSKKRPHKIFKTKPAEWLEIPDWCPLLK
jgi:hypothetical protein